MTKREEALRSPEYWFEDAQDELYRQVVNYMEREGINQTQLAERLGVTKGYISQVLKGEFNYTLKKFIDLSLAVGMVPRIDYKPVEEIIAKDKITFFFLPYKLANSNSSMRIQTMVNGKALLVDRKQIEFVGSKAA